MLRKELLEKSIRFILENQSACGSFPASPSFPQFRYCWIRDGLYTAHGALVAGHPESARAFYMWVHNTLLRHRDIVDKLRHKIETGQELVEGDFLPARFTMDGHIEQAQADKSPFYYTKWPEIYSLKGVNAGKSWPNFQTDCYGAWLWGICAYAERSGDFEILEECRASMQLTVDYLRMTWQMPCFDPWEEYGQQRSIASMGSIAGGLLALNRYWKDPSIDAWIEEIRATLRGAAASCGFFPKYIGGDQIDGDALWLFQPFEVFADDDPLTLATMDQIRQKLCTGGVKRYLNDVYYGGGEWIVLTCWLAWYDIRLGKLAEAERLLSWCEEHAEPDGGFAEQVLEHLNFPQYKEIWEVNWWHQSPAPLLWAHAMYLIACDALECVR